MSQKISYFVTSALLVVILLLPHHSNFCHATEEDSQCGCPDTNLPKNSVNEGSGVGIQFMMKNSVSGCGRRNTFISGNTVVVAAATLALYGSIRELNANIPIFVMLLPEGSLQWGLQGLHDAHSIFSQICHIDFLHIHLCTAHNNTSYCRFARRKCSPSTLDHLQ